ncbi:OO_Ba0013J05-OO_Ba0033A15.14 protein [Striga asiatica]|uniref:OO_Ba0013J05-OO_Ba0033A15.14 protein n=1 Tax=Striga asiatica TaxID=4170 RepID=A0A5A7PPH3_STRAF|nr:OO_Ba0013J05-OO_Ba0033A15.14 protein [Striga asiatica]
MGSCLSKKSARCSSPLPSSQVTLQKPPENLQKWEPPLEKKKTEDENVVKKEIFIIRHRKSHEIERQRPPADEENGENAKSDVDKGTNLVAGNVNAVVGAAPVRTSSCTKEEVDAILIQCGRLSRSSSSSKPAAAPPSEGGGGRRYSGSKRSFDFDAEGAGGGESAAREREDRQGERRRQSHGRRRTPSRERENQQQRSGSRERGGSRRVSRSPGRRSESPISSAANSNSNLNSSAAGASSGCSRPGKMVSVPATVSSMAMDKSQDAAGVESGSVRRIQVKRNVSPRTRSPARTRGLNEGQNGNIVPNQQQIMSLSRSNSRKEHSPYRRNPLAEIDTNIVPQAPIQKPYADSKTTQAAETKNNKNLEPTAQETPENPKPQPLIRSRSSRLSRDLDTINPTNPNNYTALLLEDIQNFHQKNNNNNNQPAFSLPPCVTKACSILEAVADLNSSTGSNLSSNFKKTMPGEAKDPILESEIVAKDDLMEPSFHKYVTVRRGSLEEDGDAAAGEEESSGSNSFAAVSGSQWLMSSTSGWEPNSAESTDRWTSSSSCSRSVVRLAGSVDESGKKVASGGGKKRDLKNGIERGRVTRDGQ